MCIHNMGLYTTDLDVDNRKQISVETDPVLRVPVSCARQAVHSHTQRRNANWCHVINPNLSTDSTAGRLKDVKLVAD